MPPFLIVCVLLLSLVTHAIKGVLTTVQVGCVFLHYSYLRVTTVTILIQQRCVRFLQK